MPRVTHKGFLLPDTIEGDGLLSFCISIPNAPEYIQAFWGQLFELGNAWNWEHDTPDDDRWEEAAQIWRDVLEADRQAFELNQGCATMTEPEIYGLLQQILFGLNDIKNELRTGLHLRRNAGKH